MISIIIPAYNEEAFIVKALLYLNTLKKEATFETFVCNSGSTDSTVEVSKPYATIINAPKGKAKQMNLAAKHDKGEILFFVHAYMTVPPGALSAIKNKIANGCDSGVYSNVPQQLNDTTNNFNVN